MFIRLVTYFGQPLAVMCDGRCDKAWGKTQRPLRDEENWCYDDELGIAPEDPGTYEGGEGKPFAGSGTKLSSKWCIRECERCTWANSIGRAAVEYQDLRAAKEEGDAH